MAKETKKEVKKDIRVVVKQVRGAGGQDPKCRATLCALGLGRIGKKKEFNFNPAVIGMVRRVKHLVEVYSL